MFSDVARSFYSSVSLPRYFPHGGGIEAAARDWQCDVANILDLSTGLHPDGAPRWLGDWLNDHAGLAAHYPDVHGEPARSALADALGVDTACVLIAAGAQAVIEVIFQAMNWHSIAIEVPCYCEPIRCAQRANVDVRAFEQGESIPDSDMFWVTSPSSPPGLEQGVPEGLEVVLDESYMPFAEREKLGLKRDMVRVGSLTKIFCIPGLRLGYGVANADAIKRLQRWLPPWPTSTLTLHLLPVLLCEAGKRDARIIRAKTRMTYLLKTCGWHVLPSASAFVLAEPATAPPDFSAHRILVRTFPEWPQWAGRVRLGFPGSEEAWKRLEACLCPSL